MAMFSIRDMIDEFRLICFIFKDGVEFKVCSKKSRGLFLIGDLF